jgi:hypothetical protein
MFPEARVDVAIQPSVDKGLCSMFPVARVDWQLIKDWIKDVFHVPRETNTGN